MGSFALPFRDDSERALPRMDSCSFERTLDGMRMLLVSMSALIAAACSGAPLPRETTASNARIDDHWLDGDGCPSGADDGSKLRIEELASGDGKVVMSGERVRVHYVARLPNGTVVHDTPSDGLPVELVIGSTKIICGFERALLGMHAGAERRVTVPWQLAFGDSGKPPEVPPRTDVVFVIDLFVLPEAPQEHNAGPQRPPSAGRGGGGGRGAGGH